jgi:hypothetical protein
MNSACKLLLAPPLLPAAAAALLPALPVLLLLLPMRLGGVDCGSWGLAAPDGGRDCCSCCCCWWDGRIGLFHCNGKHEDRSSSWMQQHARFVYKTCASNIGMY